jgi:hypothetical protein
MKRHSIGPRAEFRKKESQRMLEAPSLADQFPKLKRLKVDLAFHAVASAASSSDVKYLVNLGHTKSVFRFDCLNNECVRGDFDLSEPLAQAVAAHKTIAMGELHCQGWHSKDTIHQVRCSRVLRYKISLGF